MTHYNVVNIRLDDRSWQDKANCLGSIPTSSSRSGRVHPGGQGCAAAAWSAWSAWSTLVNGEKFGIWGGMSERERRRLRRQRAQAARRPVVTA
jgi:WhiB family redox-sensing transcriptional regulator